MADSSQRIPTAIAWYSQDDYDEIRSIMSDADVLAPTYAEFLLEFEAAKQRVIREGGQPFRVHVQSQKFAEWCRSRGDDIDEKGRQAFCSFVLINHEKTRSHFIESE